MTIQEALNKATEGGYHIHGADGMATDYAGANNEYSVWTRKDNESSFIVTAETMFLDPCFWQALSRALAWDREVMTVCEVRNGRPTVGTRAGQHWLYCWHRFIDSLAEGQTPESFFKSLPEHG